MASDQELPGQFTMSLGGESLPFTMQAEARHMTIEEAVASGLSNRPDEPRMVRTPITIEVMIPSNLLQPPEPPERQPELGDPSGMVGDDAIARNFRTILGPAAAEDGAAFRDMLKATRRRQGRGSPRLPVAEPIDTTDVDLPRIAVGGAPSGDARDSPAAAEASAGLVPATATGSNGLSTARALLPAAPARQAAAGNGVTGSTVAAVPSPIEPATLPQAPLDPAHYATVVARNRYLASKYDPSSTIDRAENLFTGAMSDPARVLTPSEHAEHRALSAAIVRTLVPPPTPDEARLDAMAASPLGTIASLGVNAAGGSQASQDLALDLGAAAEGIGLSAAGARAGPATAFLGAQTGGSVPIKPQSVDAAQEKRANAPTRPLDAISSPSQTNLSVRRKDLDGSRISQKSQSITRPTNNRVTLSASNAPANNGGSIKIEAGSYSESELQAAQQVADDGNDVALRQPSGQRSSNGDTSDLLINGLSYDIYTPETSNPTRVIDAIAKKAGQAQGVVVILNQTSVKVSDLGDIGARLAGKGIRNLNVKIIGE